MANQYKNKVIYNGNTLIDLTSDTVTPDKLVLGTTAHDASGELITGEYDGTEWTSGVYQDEDGYICVSPLPAAGGVDFDDGMVTFPESIVGSYPDGDDIGYGQSESNELITNFVPVEITLSYGQNCMFYVIRPGFRFQYEHTYKIALDATCGSSAAKISIYLGTIGYAVFTFSVGQDGLETITAELDRDVSYTSEIMIHCRTGSNQINSCTIRSFHIYDVTQEENTNG